MNRSVKNFVQVCSRIINAEPRQYDVLEVGSRQMSGQEGFADIREYFKGHRFIGSDYLDGKGVDMVIDVRKTGLPDGQFDIVICTEVIEHVDEPKSACQELFRILRNGGYLILTVPMNVRIHGSPNDYWRFTEQGVGKLLEQFEDKITISLGDPNFPRNVACLARKGIKLDEKPAKVLRELEELNYPLLFKLKRSRCFKLIRKLLPIIFIDSNFEFFLREKHKTIFYKLKHLVWLLQPLFMREK
jgi:SAM-dependent methyltransferase